MTPAEIAFDLTTREVPGIGRVAYVLPVVTESVPPAAREGLARRRITAMTGRCPCGARMVMPNRATRRARKGRNGAAVQHVAVEHEHDCPAGDERLSELLGCSR